MWDQLDETISDFIVNQLFLNMFRNNLLTIKSLIVASSWSHIYLLIKDARSFEHKKCFNSIDTGYSHFLCNVLITLVNRLSESCGQ